MPSIKFKNFNDAYSLSSLHPQLKEIFNFVVNECDKEGIELEITSVCRDDGGVHSTSPTRGIDLVPVDRDTTRMEWIRRKVNDTFDYGKEGFEIVPPIHHGTGPHVHCQARNETQRRENATA